ncbi:MAG: LysM peptidoglycan-binding domain-containing protein [Cyanobacteriota bacterium]
MPRRTRLRAGQPPGHRLTRRQGFGARLGVVLGPPLLCLGSALVSALAPAPAPAQPSDRPGSPGTIVVAVGDTLEGISSRHGLSLSALIEANALPDPGRLQVGQVLRLPPPGAVVLIRPGDTLEVLAARHGRTVGQLQAANPTLVAERLPVGGWLRLTTAGAPAPMSPSPAAAATTPAGTKAAVTTAAMTKAAAAAAPSPAVDQAPQAEAALLLSSAERRDRAELALREAGGLVQWKRFGDTQVDWNGWRLHPGGVRVTLVKPAAADLGPRRALATAVAVQCSTLRQTWRVDGAWEPWVAPQPRSIAQRIVLDLCSNTLDGPAVPVPDAPAPSP